MSQVKEFKAIEKQEETVEVKESNPFVWTRINKNFETAIISAGQTFSEQMFASGNNRYVQSYTEVTEPTIDSEYEITLNKNKKFTLPVSLPSLMSWVCCEKNEFNIHVNNKVIPFHDRGLLLYPSWVEGVQVEATTRSQIIKYGSLSVPLKHKQ